MIKHIILIIALSVAVILGMTYAQQGIQYLLDAHEWISQVLTDVFTVGQAGNLARNLIALLAIPFIIGFIPAFLFWLLRKHWPDFFMRIMWIVWLVQVGALLVATKVVT